MGRIAVVSGANQGLGFALAEGLARRLAHGDSVYLTGRSAERLGDAAARISAPIADVDTQVLDVRDGAAVAAFAVTPENVMRAINRASQLKRWRRPIAGLRFRIVSMGAPRVS